MAVQADFQPDVTYIASITQAQEAVVTTTTAHGYVTGTIVRLYIPLPYGMQQIDKQQAPITVLTSTSFSVPIDTLGYDPFAVPMAPEQNAQVVPIGEITSILTAAKTNKAGQT